MIMRRELPEIFRGTMSDKVATAKGFLEEIEKRFAKKDKAETNTLLASLISTRYKGNGNIREYIMEMSHLASKLATLKLELSKELLLHLVLISLPAHFSQFKVSYNCQKEKWTLNELISYCVQEEERLKQDNIETANLAGKDGGKKIKKSKEAASGLAKKKQYDETKCFFCRIPGHQKRECAEYHTWRAKKSTTLAMVCFKVN